MATLIAQPPAPAPPVTGLDVRLLARTNALTNTTSGLAPSHLQANLLILPAPHASDFRLLCARNPVPCPLIGESAVPGAYSALTSHLPNNYTAIASDVDIRRDAPRYNVYVDGRLTKEGCLDITAEWQHDHVAFLIGCSFSFEGALSAAGLPPRHTLQNRIVPMYRTQLPLCPAGVFTGSTYVVSMRVYRGKEEVQRVRDITRAYHATHGEPVDWGWDALARLGIVDVDVPQWGDAPLTADGRRPLSEAWAREDEIPVFWGCGVTPQEAVVRAGIEGVVMAHAPGHMVLLDCTDADVVSGGC
ncbi:Uu.00g071150.m01.CDS01 [Anthostomella pinea]|uniref:Uu.00g071150.m01.CDS01 n=1 Tax=Anthostomella pinea TaxID=933095 RepID=A0AAI8VVP6_9PEZI|nr:Uu.00g071150.m01.CDS01 [Anthostomella pinea]